MNEISEEGNIIRRSLIPYESFYSSEPFPFRPLNCNRFKVGLSFTFHCVEFSRSLLPLLCVETTINPFKLFSSNLYKRSIRIYSLIIKPLFVWTWSTQRCDANVLNVTDKCYNADTNEQYICCGYSKYFFIVHRQVRNNAQM